MLRGNRADVECDIVRDVLRSEALFTAFGGRSTMSIGFGRPRQSILFTEIEVFSKC